MQVNKKLLCLMTITLATACSKPSASQQVDQLVEQTKSQLSQAKSMKEADHILKQMAGEITTPPSSGAPSEGSNTSDSAATQTQTSNSSDANASPEEICKAMNEKPIEDLYVIYGVLENSNGKYASLPCRRDLLLKVEADAHARIQTYIEENKTSETRLGLNDQTGLPNKKATPALDQKYFFAGLEKGNVALTFDDGPHPRLTPSLLELLDSENSKSTFFMIGQNAELYKETALLVQEKGNTVGSHSYQHPDMSKLTTLDAQKEFEHGVEAILSAVPFMHSLHRFPYGASTPEFSKFLYSNKIAEINWAVDSEDWKTPNPNELAAKTVKFIQENKRGVIVLFHDIKPQSVAAMPEIMRQLKKLGIKTWQLEGERVIRQMSELYQPQSSQP